MAYLKQAGFTSILLSDLVQSLQSGVGMPKRSFVLTIDDGFRNVYEVAFPCLRELGFVATIFPVTGYLGRVCGWDIGERNRRAGVHSLELMTWGQVLELSRHGFEFGSHGVEHLRLTDVAAAAVRVDLRKSKEELEERLGQPCRLFCYPYGAFDDTTKEIVRETGFSAAVSLRFGRNDASTDRYSLRRIGSARFTNMQVFKSCVYGTYGFHRRGRNGSA
jgi:peptidoglycan/xylan/chitin deacetylase (PgdA/CDA1 family)